VSGGAVLRAPAQMSEQARNVYRLLKTREVGGATSLSSEEIKTEIGIDALGLFVCLLGLTVAGLIVVESWTDDGLKVRLI
jgi:hypothetical protein